MSGERVESKPSWKFVALGVALLFAILAAGITYVYVSHEWRFRNDPYIRANEEYVAGVQQAGRGNYRQARENLAAAMRELERSPGAKPAKLPVPPSALSHNTSALLAVISAKLRRCGDYRIYSALTDRIAQQDWAFSLQGKNNRQTDLDKKAAMVYKAQQEIRSVAPACPDGKNRLPLKQNP